MTKVPFMKLLFVVFSLLTAMNIPGQNAGKVVFPDTAETTASFQSQKPNITESELLLERGDYFYEKAVYDSALIFYNSGLALAKSNNELQNQVSFYTNIGCVYDNIGNFELAKQYIQTALSLSLEAGDAKGFSTALNVLGGVVFRFGDYKRALQLFYFALYLKQEGADYVGMSSVLNNIGNVFYTWGDYKKALEFQKQAYHLVMNGNDSTELPGIILNIGNSYLSLEVYDSALYYYDAAIELTTREGNSLRLVGSLNNKAYLYMNQGKYEEAMLLLGQAATIAKQKNYQLEYVYILRNIGECYLKTGSHDQALQYLNEATHLSDSIGLVDLLINLMELQSEAYEQTGQFEKALHSFKMSKKLNDSIFSMESRQNMYDYQMMYENRIRENKMLLKDLQIEAHKSKVRNQWFVFTIIMVLLLSLFVVFWMRQKNIARLQTQTFERKIVKYQQMALSAQMNPHFISNSLNSIQKFYVLNDYENASEYLSEFGALIRIILENSAQDMISVSEELKFIRSYIKLENLRLDQKFNYHIHVNKSTNTDNVFIPPLILQPFVENAIWHGIAPLATEQKPQLFINIDSDEHHLIVLIDDDGIGIEAAQELKKQFTGKRKSFAMDINTKRLELLEVMSGRKMILEIEDKKHSGSRGTKIVIRIPLIFAKFTN